MQHANVIPARAGGGLRTGVAGSHRGHSENRSVIPQDLNRRLTDLPRQRSAKTLHVQRSARFDLRDDKSNLIDVRRDTAHPTIGRTAFRPDDNVSGRIDLRCVPEASKPSNEKRNHPLLVPGRGGDLQQLGEQTEPRAVTRDPASVSSPSFHAVLTCPPRAASCTPPGRAPPADLHRP